MFEQNPWRRQTKKKKLTVCFDFSLRLSCSRRLLHILLTFTRALQQMSSTNPVVSSSSSSSNDIKTKSEETAPSASSASLATRVVSQPVIRSDLMLPVNNAANSSTSHNNHVMSSSSGVGDRSSPIPSFLSPRSPKGVVGALRPRQRERLIRLISFELTEVRFSRACAFVCVRNSHAIVLCCRSHAKLARRTKATTRSRPSSKCSTLSKRSASRASAGCTTAFSRRSLRCVSPDAHARCRIRCRFVAVVALRCAADDVSH